MSIERPIPAEHAPPGSINHYTNQLHVQRPSYDAQGMLLLLPRTRLTVVPCERRQRGWSCVVVSTAFASARTREAYPRGGYNLYIGDDEIETAIAVNDLAYNPTEDPGHPIYGIQPEHPA